MPITSAVFLLFLLVSAALYYLLPGKLRWTILLGASAFFYLTHGWKSALWLAFTIGLTWGIALLMGKAGAMAQDAESKKRAKQTRRTLLTLGLAVNFLTLLVLKYSGFFVANYNHVRALFGGEALPLPSFLSPLGISFYIFQSSAYLIDVSRGKISPEKNPARFALFACYFPQMVQGPINRFGKLAPQLFAPNEFRWENIRRGILRMMFGILKKAFLADAFAGIVAKIYGEYDALPGVVSLVGSALYCLVLYCDFSGGVDLVLGASNLYGVTMEENFRQPYFAASLDDFWRRWHISLGEWMKDYVFYPLALSQSFGKMTRAAKKKLPDALVKRLSPSLATLAVFLLVGLWQGPGWQNIAYGLWNGFWMTAALFVAIPAEKLKRRHPKFAESRFVLVARILQTNLLLIFGRIFSHSESLRQALGMLRRVFTAPGFSALTPALFSSLGFTPARLLQLIVGAACLFALSYAKERGVDLVDWFSARPPVLQFVLLFFALFLIVTAIYGNAGYIPIAYVYENL